jgi:hypothetical protein
MTLVVSSSNMVPTRDAGTGRWNLRLIETSALLATITFSSNAEADGLAVSSRGLTAKAYVACHNPIRPSQRCSVGSALRVRCKRVQTQRGPFGVDGCGFDSRTLQLRGGSVLQDLTVTCRKHTGFDSRLLHPF